MKPDNSNSLSRQYPIGAEIIPSQGVSFRIWAPAARSVCVQLEHDPPGSFLLEPEGDGYYSGITPQASAGALYRFQFNGEPQLFPDPASRFQPSGPHGKSTVIDPSTFHWTDQNFPGVELAGQIVYELHVGTFTREGTWKAAAEQLQELASAGISLVELMPIPDFPGRFGWGYDGVGLFAPYWVYGEPDDVRAFIDKAHSLGIGVILDVVYNHFGPDGNYLKSYAPDFFSKEHTTDWGEAINFDGVNSGPVREFFIANATYWIREFHFDGLRLDATQDIFDTSPTHILQELTAAARKAAGKRKIVVIAENEPQNTTLVRPIEAGGFGMDALWNDDFHHSALVALTGRNEAYYTDYEGTPQEFISAIKYGYLYQGQWYKWQTKNRGSAALDLDPKIFVTFFQNHDQVANTARGERPNILTNAGKYKAMSALLLLAPGTPMLFQGQEFAATTPFLFFCDHQAELSKMVREGRSKFLAQFRSLGLPEMQHVFGDPGDSATFIASKLDFSERQSNAALYCLTKDLIKLRRTDPVFSQQKQGGVDGAVVSPNAFILRYFGKQHGDRLVLINFGRDLHLDPAPEPLLAPPWNSIWKVIWSSEDPKYGGYGTYPPFSEDNWRFPGYSAVVLCSEKLEELHG